MSENMKNIVSNLDLETNEGAAAAAEAVEDEARQEPADEFVSYTHVFKTPFQYEGRTYEKLTFDWESLSGRDSLDIEAELRKRGINLVVPAYTGAYLTGMAARACTERNTKGKRFVTNAMIQSMPLGAFQKICGSARTFLLLAE